MSTERKKPYADIIDLPHHTSGTRPRMSRSARAAQFAPFAALTGYSDVIEESGRYTSERRELSESSTEELNRKLLALAEVIERMPEITVTYFVPDSKKSGGAYIKRRGRLKKIDEFKRCLVMQDKSLIPIDDIFEIEEAPL